MTPDTIIARLEALKIGWPSDSPAVDTANQAISIIREEMGKPPIPEQIEAVADKVMDECAKHPFSWKRTVEAAIKAWQEVG